jgi:hypothetical protein
MPKLGDILVVVKPFEFNGRYYNKGDRFKIVGNSGFRGWDLEDMNGKRIDETAMMSGNFISLREARDKKLKDLGI